MNIDSFQKHLKTHNTFTVLAGVCDSKMNHPVQVVGLCTACRPLACALLPNTTTVPNILAPLWPHVESQHHLPTQHAARLVRALHLYTVLPHPQLGGEVSAAATPRHTAPSARRMCPPIARGPQCVLAARRTGTGSAIVKRAGAALVLA